MLPRKRRAAGVVSELQVELTRQDLSLADLQRLTDIDAGYLSKIQRGLVWPSDQQIEAIARALSKETRLVVDWLLDARGRNRIAQDDGDAPRPSPNHPHPQEASA